MIPRTACGQWASSPPPPPVTYGRLFSESGFRRIAANLLLARAGDYMWITIIALFAKAQYGLEAASAAVLINLIPGIVMSPLTGALLDRFGRRRLVTIYFTVAAIGFGGVGALVVGNSLPLPVFLVLVAVCTVARPLGETGLRTLFPQMLERRLWDRANGVDSATFVVASLLGPAAGATLFASLGAGRSFLVLAVLYAVAAVITVGIQVTTTPGEHRPILSAAFSALTYTLGHPTLRGLAVVVSAFNFANGFLIVGVPVLVLDRFGLGPEWVGALWAASGVGGVVSSISVGRLNTDGRERRLMAVGCLGTATGVAVAGSAPSLLLGLVGMFIIGVATGPLDVGLFSLRLRRTEAQWLGRALAISQALNRFGLVAGGGFAALMLSRGVAVGFALCAIATLTGCVMVFLVVPREATTFRKERRGRQRPAAA